MKTEVMAGAGHDTNMTPKVHEVSKEAPFLRVEICYLFITGQADRSKNIIAGFLTKT
jgi:hypothetical protein